MVQQSKVVQGFSGFEVDGGAGSDAWICLPPRRLTSLGHVQHQRKRESTPDCPSLRLASGIQAEAKSITHTHTHTHSAPSSQCPHTKLNVQPRRTHSQGSFIGSSFVVPEASQP